MDALIRMAVTTTALLCSGAQPREAAGDVRPGITTRQQPALQDAWFGDDKLRHFAMSFATTAFSFAAARSAGAEDAALPGAVVVAAAAGVGKEVYDRRAGKIFSLKDLAWDALGVLAGWALLRQID